MKSKKTILISAAGGSFFPYVFDLLKSKYEIIAIDSDPEIKKIYPHRTIITSPPILGEDFITFVKDLIEKFSVSYYIPIIDEEIMIAHKIGKLFQNLEVIAPNEKFTKLCLNKLKLMAELKKKKISLIPSYIAQAVTAESTVFPIFVKPISGRGSRGARKIKSSEELKAYFLLENYEPNEIMVQDFVNGVEYTVSVTVNNKNQIIAIVPKRIIQKKGITQKAVTEKSSVIDVLCRKIVKNFRPMGPFNVQLILNSTGAHVFEINPRFSTTSLLTCEAGVNEFDKCIELLNKKRVKEMGFREGVHIFRRWESQFYE